MTARPVLISADAEVQLAAVRSWWRANRPAGTDLFDRELDAAVAALSGSAHSFPVYQVSIDGEIRRVLLPRCRYALYFSIEPAHVLVVAVWHTSRGRRPPLP